MCLSTQTSTNMICPKTNSLPGLISKSNMDASTCGASGRAALHNPHPTSSPLSKLASPCADNDEHQGRFEVLLSPPTAKKRRAWHDGILIVGFKQATLLSLQPLSAKSSNHTGGMSFVASEKQTNASTPTPLYTLLTQGALAEGYETSLLNGSYQIAIQRVLSCTVGRDGTTAAVVPKPAATIQSRRVRTTLHLTARPPTPTQTQPPIPPQPSALRQAVHQDLREMNPFVSRLCQLNKAGGIVPTAETNHADAAPISHSEIERQTIVGHSPSLCPTSECVVDQTTSAYFNFYLFPHPQPPEAP